MINFATFFLVFLVMSLCLTGAAVNGQTPSGAAGNRLFVYEVFADYSGTLTSSSNRLVPGRYRVEVKDGVVVSDEGLLEGRNLTVVIPDERSRKLGFLGFLESKTEWDFQYLGLTGRWFYGKAKITERGERITVPTGTLTADKIERLMESSNNHTTT